MRRTGKAKPSTIDEYLARVSPGQRPVLEKIRQTIRAAAPGAEECISYQLPAFRLNGPLVGFGASANHCAFYPMSGTIVEVFKKELAGYDTSKGTIRFQPDRPLPAALVRRLVKARLAEKKGGERDE
ncbi:MAG: iron chaperone [Burkholderiales bacterium]